MSIHDFLNKIKGDKLFNTIDNTTVMYLGILILVGVSSFYFGRFSIENRVIGVEKGVNTYTPNRAKMSPLGGLQAQKEANVGTTISNGEYFASKNGKLYYSYGCKAGNRIAKKNIINFASSSEAESAGYKLSPACK